MITVNNLTFSHGVKTIFNEAAVVFDNTKTALVGRNGSGKTTLFNILDGKITDYEGDIIYTGNTKIGYIHQEMQIEDSDVKPIQYIKNNISYYNNYNKLLSIIENTSEPDNDMLNRLALYEDHYRHMEGYSLEERAQTMLINLGFGEHIEKPIKALSYGFRMRLMLARVLLEDNNMLLLDEPTNHLDLPSIKWLEQFLINTERSAIIVSHDRAFLDAVCRETVELSGHKLNKYKGNYSYFSREKSAIVEKEKQELNNLIEEEKQLVAFINKWKAKNTKVSMAHSREKVLNKVRKRIASINIIKERDASFSYHNVDPIMSRKGISGNINDKSYNEITVLRNMYIDAAPQKRIFLIGRNGIGKSTLVRILAKKDSDFSGNIECSDKLNILFFDFDRIARLPGHETVLSFIRHIETNEFRAKSLLGMMLFGEDDYDKPINVLSGGEKVRLYMSRLFVSKFSFIILDEPTNYLDIDTIDIFIRWLKGLKCGFIIVSHNEYLLKSVNADELWQIEDAGLKIHFGNYIDFQKFTKKREYAVNSEISDEHISSSNNDKKRRQAIINKRIEINRHIKNIEDQISALESERDHIFEELKNPKTYRESPESVKQIRAREQEINNKLESLYEKWNELIDDKPILD